MQHANAEGCTWFRYQTKRCIKSQGLAHFLGQFGIIFDGYTKRNIVNSPSHHTMNDTEADQLKRTLERLRNTPENSSIFLNDVDNNNTPSYRGFCLSVDYPDNNPYANDNPYTEIENNNVDIIRCSETNDTFPFGNDGKIHVTSIYATSRSTNDLCLDLNTRSGVGANVYIRSCVDAATWIISSDNKIHYSENYNLCLDVNFNSQDSRKNIIILYCSRIVKVFVFGTDGKVIFKILEILVYRQEIMLLLLEIVRDLIT